MWIEACPEPSAKHSAMTECVCKSKPRLKIVKLRGIIDRAAHAGRRSRKSMKALQDGRIARIKVREKVVLLGDGR